MNFSQLKMWVGFIYASLSWCNPMYNDLIDTWRKLPNFSLSLLLSVCLPFIYMFKCVYVSIYMFKSFISITTSKHAIKKKIFPLPVPVSSIFTICFINPG